jgi:hypothetical protein
LIYYWSCVYLPHFRAHSVGFGANLYSELEPEVTHIISRDAHSTHVQSRTEDDEVYVVDVAWLWESTFRWERQDEKAFGLPGVEVVLGEEPVIRMIPCLAHFAWRFLFTFFTRFHFRILIFNIYNLVDFIIMSHS